MGLVLAGCEAKATLEIELRDNASGTLNLVVDLDEQAAAALRRDAYNPVDFETLFDAKKLQDAGFTTNVEDGEDSRTLVKVSTRFEGEEQLRGALHVLADEKVVDASISVTQSSMREKRQLSLQVDLDKLKSIYLEDDTIRENVEESGMEFSEFEEVVNSAFNSSTLNVKLASGSQSSEQTVGGDNSHQANVNIEASSFRAKYVFNIVGAVISLILAAVVIWRLCRRPPLLSNIKK